MSPKTLRVYYWLIQGFIRRHYKIILGTTLVVAFVVFLVTTLIRLIPPPIRTERIGRVGKYTTTTLPKDIQEHLTVGLTITKLNGEVEPGLASRWEIKDDGKTYVFTLAPGITWHDNRTLVSGDLQYDFKEVSLDSEDRTLTFHLEEPFAPFLDVISKPMFKDKLVGTGEYRAIDTKLRNGYIQDLTLSNGSNALAYKFYPTEQSLITAYKLGEIDKIENLTYKPSEFGDAPNTTIVENVDENKFAVIFFNNNDSHLKNKKIRQALAYALPDKSFGHEKANSPVSKHSWVYNENVREYGYDPSKAAALLKEEEPNPSNMTIEIKTTIQYLDEAEMIAKNWKEVLGINTEVRVVTNMTTEYQVMLVDFAPPKDPDQYGIWHSTQLTNITHYQNLKIDKLLEDGRKTIDPEQRRQIYQDFQRFLMDDVPALFLFHSSTYDIVRKPYLNF